MRIFARNVVMLWLAILAMVTLAAVPAVPAFAQEEPGNVDVNFNLAIDGEVPEGTTVGLNFPGTADIGASFCSPDSALPLCEDGGSYAATFFSIGGGEPSTGPFTTVAGQPLSYEYQVYAADGSLVETIESDTITPTEDTTVNVTYSPEDGQTPAPGNDEEPGSGDQYENEDPPATNDPSITSSQYVDPRQPSLPVDSSGDNGQSVAVLPDTGGASLAVGLLGALMIGGGLLARRILSAW